MKKKILAGVLMGMMLLQMTAVGAIAEEAADSTAAAEENAEAGTDETQVEAENEKFATGSVEGETYVQEFFGFQIDLSEGWTFADEEAMKELGNTVSNAGSETIKEAIDSGTSYLDMYAENSGTYQNINATITKISMAEAIMFKANPDDMISKMIEPVKVQMEQVGLTGAEVTKDEIEFMGEKVPCVRIISYPESLGGEIALYQTQVYFQEGTYLCSLTASAYIEDTTEDALGMCSKLGADGGAV